VRTDATVCRARLLAALSSRERETRRLPGF
jgi:hypothetical protein